MKLGFVRESIRLYFPWDSFMVLLGETLEEEGSGIHSEDKLFPADGNCSETERKKQKRRILNELNVQPGLGPEDWDRFLSGKAEEGWRLPFPRKGRSTFTGRFQTRLFLKAVIELFWDQP